MREPAGTILHSSGCRRHGASDSICTTISRTTTTSSTCTATRGGGSFNNRFERMRTRAKETARSSEGPRSTPDSAQPEDDRGEQFHVERLGQDELDLILDEKLPNIVRQPG